jgi:tRNA threonylcarbamoyladenosine biosynthesis protein TsaB
VFILILRTDKPEAEIGLFDGQTQLSHESWLADRQLSSTIHAKIRDLLGAQGRDFRDLQGIVCFEGPGSFTGLRIGITVADSLAYGLSIPIVAARGESWIQTGVDRLLAGQNDRIALPHYGAPVHITKQKK